MSHPRSLWNFNPSGLKTNWVFSIIKLYCEFSGFFFFKSSFIAIEISELSLYCNFPVDTKLSLEQKWKKVGMLSWPR